MGREIVPESLGGGQQHVPAGSRLLLLDTTGNLHSLYHPDRVLTGCYWDVLATLPSLVPPGPLGLLGLGAGTVPRAIAAHFRCGPGGDGDSSSYVVHGWELDPGVVMAGRMYLGMAELERSGQLVVYTGDALAPTASIPGGFSGIIVDLFSKGCLLPQLTERATWESLRSRLAPIPGSRLIANLGQAPAAAQPGSPAAAAAQATGLALEALREVFEGEVSMLTVEENTLILTGPTPGPEEWPGRLPDGLRHLGAPHHWERVRGGGAVAVGGGGARTGEPERRL
ncbi:hypothetical protein GPECTOR_32g505 [Gonium pectorale]|uniref:PABS domain-containing protein n=1 Tax=Gonium pectorale TaxID=33097 RepID=A0A150GDH6_GONPE|nr:hypothetical protein GPECTOR_32g505 [Gonium pectorale]|eukprot:KXZ47892.1 hypothetical protein GPECTOR_32g505 [Gonium pectorale]